MNNVSKRLKDERTNSRIILQIHDELIVQAPDEEVEYVKELLVEEMENVVDINVKLLVEVEVGMPGMKSKVIVITGSIATGKSKCFKVLKRQGLPSCLDAR